MTFFAIFLAGVAALAGLVLGCSGAGAASSPGAPASGPSTSSASPASTAPARPEPLSPTTGKYIKLLAVGNSFSANATRYLPDIVRVSGNVLTFGHAAVGGCSLEQHWSYVEAFEENPGDPKGRPYTYDGHRASLKEMLTAQKWDFVTIQQYSVLSYRVETYRPWAKDLYDYIKKHAPQAEVLIHQTWAYREDDPMFKDGKKTQQQMFDGLRDAYVTVAKELGCRIIPVGQAFQNARQDPAWTFKSADPNFDYANPKYPALPDQTHSLNAGYAWYKDGKGGWKLAIDGHHANTAGEYLGAAVWFEVFLADKAKTVIGNSFVPPGLSKEQTASLQDIAHKTVRP